MVLGILGAALGEEAREGGLRRCPSSLERGFDGERALLRTGAGGKRAGSGEYTSSAAVEEAALVTA